MCFIYNELTYLFLALLNQQRRYIFNGQWRVSLGRRKYFSYGTAVYYSGPNAENETISIPGKLTSSVEIRVCIFFTKKMFVLFFY